jgi:hypothetical protein
MLAECSPRRRRGPVVPKSQTSPAQLAMTVRLGNPRAAIWIGVFTTKHQPWQS